MRYQKKEEMKRRGGEGGERKQGGKAGRKTGNGMEDKSILVSNRLCSSLAYLLATHPRHHFFRYFQHKFRS